MTKTSSSVNSDKNLNFDSVTIKRLNKGRRRETDEFVMKLTSKEYH